MAAEIADPCVPPAIHPATITVIDAKIDAVAATIHVGEGMEYGVGDGHGSVSIAGVEKSDLLKIDAETNAVVARWPTPDCARPHGLALDVSVTAPSWAASTA